MHDIFQSVHSRKVLMQLFTPPVNRTDLSYDLATGGMVHSAMSLRYALYMIRNSSQLLFHRYQGLQHITALSDYSLIHFSQFTGSRFEENHRAIRFNGNCHGLYFNIRWTLKFVPAFIPKILSGLQHITAFSDYSLMHFSQFTSYRFEG